MVLYKIWKVQVDVNLIYQDQGQRGSHFVEFLL